MPLVALASLVAVASLGCDAEERRKRERERARAEISRIEQLNREMVTSRQYDIAIIERYESWFERLRQIDHAALGLPEPERLPDGSTRPATLSETFCDRVTAMAQNRPFPSPTEWTAAYRDAADRFRKAIVEDSFEAYRATYIAERQLARLACLARDGGPALHRALLDFLIEPADMPKSLDALDPIDDATRYTAAVFAIKHGIDPGRGWRILEHAANGGSSFSYAANKNFHKYPPPLSLDYDINSDYHRAKATLRNELNKRPRRRGRSVRGPGPVD